jgi:hypothetical protein
MAGRSQLEIGRLRCGCSVGAEDVSGTDGLPIGQACMGGRAVISPTVPSAGVSSPRPARTCSVAARGSKSIEDAVAG